MNARPSFTTTHWSVVLAAGDSQNPRADSALEELCQNYWYPLYAYVRRKGHGPDDAQDLTQDFFTRLLQGRDLQNVDPSKGKFRSFLLASMNHFVAKHWRRGHAQKRGGGRMIFSLDAATAEEKYRLEPVDNSTPEKMFEREWAMTVLERALERLRQEFVQSGNSALFEQLKGRLTGESEQRPYAHIAELLSMTEDAVKTAAHRLRARHADCLRSEIAQTVESEAEIDAEIRYLLAIVTGRS